MAISLGDELVIPGSRIISLGDECEPPPPAGSDLPNSEPQQGLGKSPLPPIVADSALVQDGADIIAWVTKVLQSEREAIMKELEDRHRAMLADLEASFITHEYPVEKLAKPAAVRFADEKQGLLANEVTSVSVADLPIAQKADGIGISDIVEDESSSTFSSQVYRRHGSNENIPHMGLRERRALTEAAGWYCEKTSYDTEYEKEIRQSFTTNLDEVEDQIPARKGIRDVLLSLQKVILSDGFELLLAIIILVSVVAMAMFAQYNSFDIAHGLRLKGADSPAKDVWPRVKTVLEAFEFAFGSIFSLEIVVKFLVAPRLFVRNWWNFLDTTIVVLWIIYYCGVRLLLNPMLLRLLHLTRLLRLVRLGKTFQVFDIIVPYVLIGSLKASRNVLAWSMLLLSAIVICCALATNCLLLPFMQDEANTFESRELVFVRFGSFSRALVTMWEITLGNWVVPLRLLQENVGQWWGPACLIYLIFINFAVVQVIRGVFMHETFKVANTDPDIMILQKELQTRRHTKNMDALFKEADSSGDGFLNFEEFANVTKQSRMRSWLSAMEFDASDTKLVFELMDDGDHQLSADELAWGISRLKGPARSLDLEALYSLCTRMDKNLSELRQKAECPSRQKSE